MVRVIQPTFLIFQLEVQAQIVGTHGKVMEHYEVRGRHPAIGLQMPTLAHHTRRRKRLVGRLRSSWEY
jgi:hypothetical protein